MERINDIDTIIKNAEEHQFWTEVPKVRMCEALNITRPTLDRIIRIGKLKKPYRMWDVYYALIDIRRRYECDVVKKFQQKRKSL